MSKIIYKGFFYINQFFRKKISSELYNKNAFILPNFIGFTLYIYDGKNFIPCFVNVNKIGYKFDNFSKVFKISKKLRFKDFSL